MLTTMLTPNALHSRRLLGEVMDDPGLEHVRHTRALAGLARINRLSLSVSTLHHLVQRLLAIADRRIRRDGPVRLLDVASGSGDVCIGLARAMRRAGTPLRVSACDISQHACDTIRARARAADTEIDVFRADAISQTLPGGFDIVHCGLFMHHLSSSQVVATLRNMARAARGHVLVTDLDRSTTHLLLARIVPRMVTLSDVVHTDAVRSVLAAFKPHELARLFTQAGLTTPTAQRIFPCRFAMHARVHGASTP